MKVAILLVLIFAIATPTTQAGWFSKDEASDAKRCDQDALKVKFIKMCTDDLTAVQMQNGKELSEIDITPLRAACKCAALNFDLEEVATKSCGFVINTPGAFMNRPAVQLKCL